MPKHTNELSNSIKELETGGSQPTDSGPLKITLPFNRVVAHYACLPTIMTTYMFMVKVMAPIELMPIEFSIPMSAMMMAKNPDDPLKLAIFEKLKTAYNLSELEKLRIEVPKGPSDIELVECDLMVPKAPAGEANA